MLPGASESGIGLEARNAPPPVPGNTVNVQVSSHPTIRSGLPSFFRSPTVIMPGPQLRAIGEPLAGVNIDCCGLPPPRAHPVEINMSSKVATVTAPRFSDPSCCSFSVAPATRLSISKRSASECSHPGGLQRRAVLPQKPLGTNRAVRARPTLPAPRPKVSIGRYEAARGRRSHRQPPRL